MNKKGFVLIETLVVTIFVMFIFSILYNSVVPLLGKYEELSYYDDLDITYDLYHLRKLIINDTNFETIKGNDIGYQKITCSDLENKSYCETIFTNLAITDDDSLVYLDISHLNDLKNDSDYSYDLREYLKYIDTNKNILLLENDDKLSYIEVKSTVVSERVLEDAMNLSCTPYVKVDNVVYLSGDNNCVNFNYVWYSGKLWRITAIYPDGSMKMITDDLITTINWGEKATVSSTDTTSAYSTSFIREWLNQEFLPTLYNHENIIVPDAGWYSIMDSNYQVPPKKPTGSPNIIDPIGLLNAYEYYISNTNKYSYSYLDIKYSWWLITPNNTTRIRYVDEDGKLAGYTNTSTSSDLTGNPPLTGFTGVRPAIVLKSGIQLTGGTGVLSNPYTLKDDKEESVINTTLLNTRSSGEYVKLENDPNSNLFRIVDTEMINNKLTTKLVLNDYVKENGVIVTKYFSSSNTYKLWSQVDKVDETYWRGYLNNTWLKQIDNTYNETTDTSNILEKGVYYLGYYIEGTYKNTVCKSVSSELGIRDCIKNGNVVSDIVNDDYVGLLRAGEIFSTQTGDYVHNTAKNLWTITMYFSGIRYVINNGGLNSADPSTNDFSVRPSINLKSTMVIKSGSGTKSDPFLVGLTS